MFNFVFSWEYWEASVQLRQYAAEAPHVDAHRVRNAQDYLRGAVEPGLDISVYSFILEATRAEVNQLYPRLVRTLQKNVFWLQVAMYDILFL